MYLLAWYDDNPRHTLSQRLSEAAEAYEARMGVKANYAAVGPSELVCEAPSDWDEIAVDAKMGKGMVKVGRRERDET